EVAPLLRGDLEDAPAQPGLVRARARGRRDAHRAGLADDARRRRNDRELRGGKPLVRRELRLRVRAQKRRAHRGQDRSERCASRESVPTSKPTAPPAPTRRSPRCLEGRRCAGAPRRRPAYAPDATGSAGSPAAVSSASRSVSRCISRLISGETARMPTPTPIATQPTVV